MRSRSTAAASLLLVGAVCGLGDAQAQVRIPRASPAAFVALDVGTTSVRIDYHRPGVKGRPIWGGLVPYDAVWRMGANNATKLTVSDGFKIGPAGAALAAGSYALFAIPRRDRWTILVNRQPEQWGAFRYKPEDDVAKFDVAPQSGPAVEWMTFTITPSGDGKASIELAWDTARVAFPIAVDVAGIVWSSIDAALAAKPDDGATLQQAARYSADSGQRLEQGLAWIEKAMAMKESFWYYEIKADLLHRLGRTREGLPLLDKVLELAPSGGAPREYLDNVEKKKAAWLAAGRT